MTVTMSELTHKLNVVRQHTGLDLYIIHLYQRSDRPYVLGLDGYHLARGSKADLYNYLTAYDLGYRTAVAR